ncbi:MAG: hypothetical protein HC902_02475 [Calothrix sp. SM1_5_4]|nr:hypothetical protein [Calothrix sp. SM1_5_4]
MTNTFANPLRALAFFLLIFSVACTTSRKAEEQPAAPIASEEDPLKNTRLLQDRLGMIREPDDLGFQEKSFNPCSHGRAPAQGCKNQYFTVVHFQLLCRDSEGSVSTVPLRLAPITSDRVSWKVGGRSGGTRTDKDGYGQLAVLSERSTRGQRLILRIGPQFVGLTVNEVSKIVLPKNFCRG